MFSMNVYPDWREQSIMHNFGYLVTPQLTRYPNIYGSKALRILSDFFISSTAISRHAKRILLFALCIVALCHNNVH